MWPKVVLSARKERLKWRLHFCEETSIIDVLVYDVKRREVEKKCADLSHYANEYVK